MPFMPLSAFFLPYLTVSCRRSAKKESPENIDLSIFLSFLIPCGRWGAGAQWAPFSADRAGGETLNPGFKVRFGSEKEKPRLNAEVFFFSAEDGT